MADPHNMEALAAVEHESWTRWTRYMLEAMEKDSEGGGFRAQYGVLFGRFTVLLNALPCVQRWRRQMATPYAELSEEEKESDRKVVREKLAVYREGTLPKILSTVAGSVEALTQIVESPELNDTVMMAVEDELVIQLGPPPDPNRCAWCGGQLYERMEDGCSTGNCALRPLPKPPHLYDPERAEKERLAR